MKKSAFLVFFLALSAAASNYQRSLKTNGKSLQTSPFNSLVQKYDLYVHMNPNKNGLIPGLRNKVNWTRLGQHEHHSIAINLKSGLYSIPKEAYSFVVDDFYFVSKLTVNGAETSSIASFDPHLTK